MAVVRVDTSEAAVDIRPGDEVLRIDGRTVRDAEAAVASFTSVSKPAHRIPAGRLMRGPKDSEIHLRIRSSRGEHDVVLPRSRQARPHEARQFPEHPVCAILPGNIGYVNIALLTTKQIFDSVMTVVARTRGLVLDGRSPDARDAEFDYTRFLTTTTPSSPNIQALSYSHGSYAPMRAVGESRHWEVPSLFPDSLKYTKPLVVMNSEFNSSAGESIAIWLRSHARAVFVGESTNGTYGPQQGITLPGGARFTFTGNRALQPDGTKYHGVGVMPDVPVVQTFAGLRARRDEVYEAAVATLRRIVSRSP